MIRITNKILRVNNKKKTQRMLDTTKQALHVLACSTFFWFPAYLKPSNNEALLFQMSMLEPDTTSLDENVNQNGNLRCLNDRSNNNRIPNFNPACNGKKELSNNNSSNECCSSNSSSSSSSGCGSNGSSSYKDCKSFDISRCKLKSTRRKRYTPRKLHRATTSSNSSNTSQFDRSTCNNISASSKWKFKTSLPEQKPSSNGKLTTYEITEISSSNVESSQQIPKSSAKLDKKFSYSYDALRSHPYLVPHNNAPVIQGRIQSQSLKCFPYDTRREENVTGLPITHTNSAKPLNSYEISNNQVSRPGTPKPCLLDDTHVFKVPYPPSPNTFVGHRFSKKELQKSVSDTHPLNCKKVLQLSHHHNQQQQQQQHMASVPLARTFTLETQSNSSSSPYELYHLPSTHHTFESTSLSNTNPGSSKNYLNQIKNHDVLPSASNSLNAHAQQAIKRPWEGISSSNNAIDSYGRYIPPSNKHYKSLENRNTIGEAPSYNGGTSLLLANDKQSSIYSPSAELRKLKQSFSDNLRTTSDQQSFRSRSPISINTSVDDISLGRRRPHINRSTSLASFEIPNIKSQPKRRWLDLFFGKKDATNKLETSTQCEPIPLQHLVANQRPSCSMQLPSSSFAGQSSRIDSTEEADIDIGKTAFVNNQLKKTNNNAYWKKQTDASSSSSSFITSEYSKLRSTGTDDSIITSTQSEVEYEEPKIISSSYLLNKSQNMYANSVESAFQKEAEKKTALLSDIMQMFVHSALLRSRMFLNDPKGKIPRAHWLFLSCINRFLHKPELYPRALASIPLHERQELAQLSNYMNLRNEIVPPCTSLSTLLRLLKMLEIEDAVYSQGPYVQQLKQHQHLDPKNNSNSNNICSPMLSSYYSLTTIRRNDNGAPRYLLPLKSLQGKLDDLIIFSHNKECIKKNREIHTLPRLLIAYVPEAVAKTSMKTFELSPSVQIDNSTYNVTSVLFEYLNNPEKRFLIARDSKAQSNTPWYYYSNEGCKQYSKLSNIPLNKSTYRPRIILLEQRS